jgi:hypothetical protein
VELAGWLIEEYGHLAPVIAARLSTVDDHLVGLALELFRTCVTPGPRAGADKRVRALIAQGIPAFDDLPESEWGREEDEDLVAAVLKDVVRHLSGTHAPSTSANLLGVYTEQLSRIFFRPWWDEYH